MAGLRSGATGAPAYPSPAEEQAELRRQQRQRPWDDATPLVRDAAQAYREVYGTAEQRELQLDSARKRPPQSTFG